METRTIAIAGTIIFTLIFSTGVVTGWFFASPPQDYNIIKTGNARRVTYGLVPLDIINTDLTGWEIVINFDGYYDIGLGTKLDYYVATKGATTLEDFTYVGIIRQIKNSQ